MRAAKIAPDDELSEAAKTSAHLKVALQDVLIGRRLILKDKLGDPDCTRTRHRIHRFERCNYSEGYAGLGKRRAGQERKVVPAGRDGYILHLAMIDPTNLETINFIRKISGPGEFVV